MPDLWVTSVIFFVVTFFGLALCCAFFSSEQDALKRLKADWVGVILLSIGVIAFIVGLLPFVPEVAKGIAYTAGGILGGLGAIFVLPEPPTKFLVRKENALLVTTLGFLTLAAGSIANILVSAVVYIYSNTSMFQGVVFTAAIVAIIGIVAYKLFLTGGTNEHLA